MQRFMLNLRQLNKTDSTETNSDAQHFSRFSVDFRVPSYLLGNISQLLDHGPSERLLEDDSCEHDESDKERPRAGDSLESAGSIAGPSGAHWDDEDKASLDTLAPLAGQFGTRVDDGWIVSLRGARPAGHGVGPSGIRGDKVLDTSRTSDFMEGADILTVDLTEEVCLYLYLYRRSPKLRAIFFPDAGGQPWGSCVCLMLSRLERVVFPRSYSFKSTSLCTLSSVRPSHIQCLLYFQVGGERG